MAEKNRQVTPIYLNGDPSYPFQDCHSQAKTSGNTFLALVYEGTGRANALAKGGGVGKMLKNDKGFRLRYDGQGAVRRSSLYMDMLCFPGQ